MTDVEAQRVLYSASFEVPYAIGSVAIPLEEVTSSPTTTQPIYPHETSSSPADATRASTAHEGTSGRRRGVTSGTISSVRRCTHHRYCYLRDGGALAEDAFYRWLQHEQQHRGRESLGGRTTTNSDAAEVGATAGSRSSPVEYTPSLFYASIDCVVFFLPNSFPNPRRVVRRPPFIIEDDTWAEHMVEAQLHFLPHLQIPPVMVVHQVLLERRTVPPPSPESHPISMDSRISSSSSSIIGSPRVAGEEVRGVWVPQLLASTYGKVKLPPVATHVRLPHPAPHSADAMMTSLAVSEKVDMLRLYHPSVQVLQHVRRVLAMAALPVIGELREAFEADLAAEDGVADVSLFCFPWSLPHEEAIATYAAQRATTSVAVLSAVLAGLKRERVAMEASCRQSLEHISALATTVIPEQLAEVHERCLKLYRKA